MSENTNISFEKVKAEDLPLFAKKLQEAFSPAVEEMFGIKEPVPSVRDIEFSFNSEGAETYYILLNGIRVGGTVLLIDKKTNHNRLELFFISPENHSRGLGLAAWRAIEAKYPDTVLWETITPYFEQRNIHFYINKCGFRIVEFFNKKHKDKNLKRRNQSNEPEIGTDVYFRFEKDMRK